MSPRDKNVSKKEISTKKDEVGNYEKHPFFLKKAMSAKKLLSKVGLPKQFSNKMHV